MSFVAQSVPAASYGSVPLPGGKPGKLAGEDANGCQAKVNSEGALVFLGNAYKSGRVAAAVVAPLSRRWGRVGPATRPPASGHRCWSGFSGGLSGR